MRNAARTDAVQGPIIRALEQVPGVKVYYLKLPVDLCVGFMGKNYLLEVKGQHGRLTKLQEEFIATWPGQVAVVRSPIEALNAIGIKCE